MASILSSSGFYKTPLTKAIFTTTLIGSCTLLIPTFGPIQRALILRLGPGQTISSFNLLWKLMIKQLVFADPKDLLSGLFLLYNFRVFEKRYGTRKFSSYLFANLLMTILFEFCFLQIFRHWTGNQETVVMPTGPWPLIFCLFINFFQDIPTSSHVNVVGIPLSGKSLIYTLGLHCFLSSSGYLISGCAGLISGIFSRANLFSVCNWIRVPAFVCDLTNRLLGRLFDSKPPDENFNGATLEIQREQQMQQFEQQFVLENDQNDASHVADAGHIEQEIEDYVNELVEMGFQRQKATQALQRTGNDIAQAAALLVEGSI